MADNYMKKYEDEHEKLEVENAIANLERLINEYEDLIYEDFKTRLQYVDDILGLLNKLKFEDRKYKELYDAYELEKQDINDAEKASIQAEEELYETSEEVQNNMETEDDFGIPGERTFREDSHGRIIEEYHDGRDRDDDDDGEIE